MAATRVHMLPEQLPPCSCERMSSVLRRARSWSGNGVMTPMTRAWVCNRLRRLQVRWPYRAIL
eukprot:3006188-Amphidinium_carterae.1